MAVTLMGLMFCLRCGFWGFPFTEMTISNNNAAASGKERVLFMEKNRFGKSDTILGKGRRITKIIP
jgi:hypothetical protein